MDCHKCQKSDLDVTLHKCPICFKPACDDCGHRAYGRVFCSRRCADNFFFGEGDED